MSVLRSALARRFISSVNAGVFRRGGDGIESPLQYPGNAAWYDASDINSMLNDAGAVPASGEGIKLWADKSGNSSVNVLCLNGVAGNYASAPDSAALSITGDIDVTCRVAMTDWTPSAAMALVAKFGSGGAVSWMFRLETTGALRWFASSDGTASPSATSSVSVGFSDFQTGWVRVTWRASDGRTQFFTAPDAATPVWVQLGTDQTNAVGALFDSNAAVTVGQRITATDPAAGNFFSAQIYNGIAGTLVFDANFATAAKLAPSFTESSSNAATVQIFSSGATGARISGARDLYQGVAANQPILTIAAGGNYLTFDGSNDYLKAAAFSLSQPETVYFVGSQISWTLNDTLYDGNSTNERMALAQAATTPNLRPFAGTTDAAMENTGLATGVNAVVTVVFNGASSRDRINRGTALTGSIGTNPGNGFTMGAAFTPGNYANITASEVLVYSTADSTPVQDAKILYLGRHNGIAV